MRKTLSIAAAALLLAPIPSAVMAQDGGGQAAEELTPEQAANVRRAARILRVFTIAIQSDDVQQAVKGKLISCMYNNTLSTISTATGQVLANNPNLDVSRPGDFYRASAGVCGVMFKRADAAAGGNSDDVAEAAASGNEGGR